jgi:hypothetical protein
VLTLPSKRSRTVGRRAYHRAVSYRTSRALRFGAAARGRRGPPEQAAELEAELKAKAPAKRRAYASDRKSTGSMDGA